MKSLKPAVAAAFVIASLFSASAWAQHGHGGGHGGGHFHGGFGHSRGHVGVVIGAPLFWPGYWYDDPFYYSYPYNYRPLVVAPASPPVYIEQGQGGAQPSWYFCDSANAYYPYVRDCPSGWRSVAPQPAPR